MTMNAGPGKTISAIPIRVTVPPTTATTMRLAKRNFDCWSLLIHPRPNPVPCEILLVSYFHQIKT